MTVILNSTIFDSDILLDSNYTATHNSVTNSLSLNGLNSLMVTFLDSVNTATLTSITLKQTHSTTYWYPKSLKQTDERNWVKLIAQTQAKLSELIHGNHLEFYHLGFHYLNHYADSNEPTTVCLAWRANWIGFRHLTFKIAFCIFYIGKCAGPRHLPSPPRASSLLTNGKTCILSFIIYI